jgi:hypothetical protein
MREIPYISSISVNDTYCTPKKKAVKKIPGVTFCHSSAKFLFTSVWI